jgi:hypothetical protein
MGVGHVDRLIVESERVRIPRPELDVPCCARIEESSGLGNHGVFPVDAGHPPWRHAGSQVNRDRSRAAANVQQVHTGPQVGQQVRGGVLRRPPAVASQHRVVVTMGIRVVHSRVVQRQRQPTTLGRAAGARIRPRQRRNGEGAEAVDRSSKRSFADLWRNALLARSRTAAHAFPCCASDSRREANLTVCRRAISI